MQYTYNDKCLMKDGQPWFPIMGEIHYSRVPRRHWKRSLERMKSLGVNVVSTYSFWNHHEEIQGEYEFTKNKNLREFVKEVERIGLKLFLRIGPWCHGEVRYGGLPDWIIEAEYEERTNDERYLNQVRTYYQKIFSQVEGLFLKDGGPIIGIQIENEYGHAGGLCGEEGEQHMRTLTKMAKEIGYDVPFYTATGWGGAVTGGLLPVMGGYCEAPWDQSTEVIEPSKNYLFSHERNDQNIGSDYGIGYGTTFDMTKFPYLTAELGGGLQVTYHRRPIATSKDIGAMSVAKLGSGVVLLGYYMFHGGTNPVGRLSTLEESKATGAPNDYPVLNYDFQGPISQYGDVSETGKEIKCLAYFLQAYGKDLCQMPAYIPEGNPCQSTEVERLRWSVRHNGESGFLFVNNYQKGQKMQAHIWGERPINIGNNEIKFPHIHVLENTYFIYPLCLKVGKGMIKYITATPLTRSFAYGWEFFYAENKEDVVMEIGGTVECEKIIVLDRREALNSWLCKDILYVVDQDRSMIIQEEKAVVLYQRQETKVRCYGNTICERTYFYPKVEKAKIDIEEIEEKYHNTYLLNLEYADDVYDTHLLIDYSGNEALLYCKEQLVADQYYYGETWEISLESLGYPKQLRLVIKPLLENDAIYLEKTLMYKNGRACELCNIAIEYVQRIEIIEVSDV